MAPGSRIARIALIVFCILLLPSVACATPIQPVHGPYPEQLPSDPTPLYIWNVPLNILTIEFVCVSAPALFIPIQILFSLSIWLRLGQKRVTYRNVLDNENRNAVYMCIQENPGILMKALSRVLCMNIGTTRYHVEVLCRVGKVFPEQNSGGVSYFVNADPFSDLERKIAGYLHDHQKSRILRFVLRHPGCTRKDIAFRLIMSGPNVTCHMKSLIWDGIIRNERDGRNMRHYLCPDVDEYLEDHEPWNSCAHPEAGKQAPYAAVKLRGSRDSG
ncbi:winged helix-turn-helix transcriptional regulator [Methanoculleus sp. UBA303]|uniref:winged helix-turn-helix transcriptional regulator n=1 Tax=Methanoculleus sp. UBA303 TaxID=1915497 RepID=UPI0025EF36D8|nr:winged helix-turn-helix transcriptional regulator [Methanoculleus sp. UBA303]MDD3932806.1 winged helix-turn-helix transcriptional regulator [Methanoculleus sp.]